MSEITSNRVFYGEDSLGGLGRMLDDGGHDSVLLVTGKKSYSTSGMAELLAPELKGRVVTRACNFEPNPKKDDIFRILNEIRDLDYSAIIAVGGGSVIDVAKLIKCFIGNAGKIDGVLHDGEVPTPSEVDLFVIPTTAGSGSEATHFAVVYDKGEKFSVAHPKLLPDASWILPSALVSMPKDVAASSAMDALCQGIESYWSIHSTVESKALAAEAIKLAWGNMLPAVLGLDRAALALMGRASHLAGEAINITKTTAPHAISYALTAHFGIAHGHAVALMLPSILMFNEGVTDVDVLDERGCVYVKSVLTDICRMIDCRDSSHAAVAISERVKSLGLPNDLIALGINDSSDLNIIVENGFNPDRVNNNPRRLSESDLKVMLNTMLADH